MVAISKQLACQKFIFKIHSSRLRKERWKLSLPIQEARRNDEVISLADSQVLRWIAELNGTTDADEKAHNIKAEIRRIRKEPNSIQNKHRIRELYMELDKIQFQPDYMCLIIDKDKDYYRACRGFSINDIRYKRLLGTNGGIKNSTIVFVSERLHDELDRRINNGRDPEKKIVTAKLEAYKALTCSASIPVSMPNGVLIVDDAETEFYEDVVYLSDETGGEPVMQERKHELIKMDASDGYGIMLPSLAERWSRELELDYVMAGCNTRSAWEKGMVFTFDFLDFADKVAGRYIVKDAWGAEVDIRNIELILTTSMVKLWDSYKSCADYIQQSIANGYTFSITKTCPKELENERCLNYQFIQPVQMSDDDINELISASMNETKEVLNADWRKTVLYLKGSGINGNNIDRSTNDFVKALMIDNRIINDPYVQNNIYQSIRNRINEAKVGVLKVHGNFSIVSGDPYLLCQSIFGLELTGLLKAGELYNRYWFDTDAKEVICYRAPMTSANNIRKLSVCRSSEAAYWYKYMDTCTILNSWDTTTSSLNGCDFDGDLVMLTDNAILLGNYRDLPTLMCVQKRAEKRISTENDFIVSNIASFGNDIGKITNRITSMFEVQSNFKPGSIEYETLSYRICCGQQYQQNAIDKSKGVVSNPMPRSWYDRHSASKIEDEKKRTLYKSIAASRKPYFMRYIYPSLMKEYNTYIDSANRNSLREFQLTIDELDSLPSRDLTDRQREFLRFYHYRMPVGTGGCVMNKICRIFERTFDGYVGKHNAETTFDYTIMKSDAEYTPWLYREIKRLYDEYTARVRNYETFAYYERVDEYESRATLAALNEEFRKECDKVCPNRRVLCNIVLDICYQKNSTKWFAWSMCADEIINNLLEHNDYTISYPVLDPNGDISFCGNRFSIETKRLEAESDDSTE